MKVYIKSSASISPQASLSQPLPSGAMRVYENYLSAVEPQYKEYIPAMKLRRMNRLVKMALSTAKSCLNQAGIEMPGAIITSSGWGCLNDTYKYLDEITAEEQLPPSPATFIQSTHNTPGGQVALHLGCQNYNNVLVNGNTSFEYALIDSIMLTSEGKNNILVGGFDEITETDLALKEEAGYWKNSTRINKALLEENTPGTMAGEGSAFFLLSTEGDNTENILTDCGVLACKPNQEAFRTALNSHLKLLNLSLADIDLCLLGANGNSDNMHYYNELCSTLFKDLPSVYYKKLCGEYDTSSSFALWLADQILKTREIPGYLVEDVRPEKLRNILIFNYAGSHKHAITIVSKASI